MTDTPASPSPLRVVVAEDEALIRLDLVEMLREEGYDVVGEAGDGEAAVRLATELEPDLVMLDVKMPVLDGISAAEQIAAARIAPVVMLTAFSQRELVERARDAGAMAYLVKPFTQGDLVPAIELAVSRYAEITTLESEVADLADRLETRKLVERAKSVLQRATGCPSPTRSGGCRSAAMDRRLPMAEVARVVLERYPRNGRVTPQITVGRRPVTDCPKPTSDIKALPFMTAPEPDIAARFRWHRDPARPGGPHARTGYAQRLQDRRSRHRRRLALAACSSSGGGSGSTSSAGGGGKTLVISTDLPLQGSSKDASDATNQAIELYLEQIGYKAGDYTIELKKYDDSTAAAGKWDQAQCTKNATDHVANVNEVAVMGTYNSGCAKIIVPVLNQDPSGPMLMVSQANTNPGLTKTWDPGEPDKYYPTGKRNYARVVTTDDNQGRAAAQFMSKDLGAKKCYILNDNETYGQGVASAFEAEAKKQGIEVLGNEPWDGKQPNYTALFQKIKGLGPDCIYLGGIYDNNGGQLIKDKVAVLGDNTAVKLMGPDGFTGYPELNKLPQGQGMYLSFPGLTNDDLRAQGGAAAKLLDAYKAKYGSDPGLELRALRRGGGPGHPRGHREVGRHAQVRHRRRSSAAQRHHGPGRRLRHRQGDQDRPGDG